MDVIAGSVPRADGAPFQPADLVTLWLSHGRNWVQLHSKLAAKGAGGRAVVRLGCTELWVQGRDCWPRLVQTLQIAA